MIQNDQKLWLVPEIYMHAGKDLWKTIISATEIYTQAPALMTSVPNCNNVFSLCVFKTVSLLTSSLTRAMD